MLACIITGYANGRTSVGRALDWCKEHIDLLRKHMELKRGIASESTISRLLNGIDEEMFALVFMDWVARLLELLDIRDNIFTIDAIGTQKNIERLIVENGGHFVLQVKKNHPALYEEIITGFETFEKELATEKKEQRAQKLKQYVEKYEKWYSQEKNRERIEYREMAVCRDATFLECVRNGETPL